MTASSTLPAPNLMPLMRYRDLAEAMGWLEQAFGFERQVAVSDSEGAAIYGQMTYRGSVIMMGAVRETDLDKLMRQPDEVGDVETQSCYLVVDDADEHCARAQDAGAEIVLELKSDGLGRRGYSCRDPQGHIWNFGTYNPARGLSASAASRVADVEEPREPANISRRLKITLSSLTVALAAACWLFSNEIRADFSSRVADARRAAQETQESDRAYAELVKVRAEKRKAELAVEAAGRDLEAERARRLALEASAGSEKDKLAQEQTARQEAERALATLREELDRKQDALEDAIEARRNSEEKLAVRSAASEPEPKPEPLAPAPGHAAEQAGSAGSPAGTSTIETSATRPMAELQSLKPDATPIASVISEVKTRPRQSTLPTGRISQKIRKPVIGRAPRPVPTYVVDLHDVPWPYSTWYKKKR
jgi:uncharacterized glyoxalase superfamily protein PhnB